MAGSPQVGYSDNRRLQANLTRVPLTNVCILVNRLETRHPVGMRTGEPPLSAAAGPVRAAWRRTGSFLPAAVVLVVAGGAALALRDDHRLKSLDEPAFVDLADNLALHGRFAHTNRPDIEGYDRTLASGELRPTAYRAPGYAWMLAPLRRLGAGYPALRIANFVLVALGLWILNSLAARHAGAGAGAIGIVLVLLYPVIFYAASTLYPQTLAAFLLLCSVSLLHRIDRACRLRTCALAGLIYGALVLTVPVFLALAPIVVGWLGWIRRAGAKRLAVVVLAISAPAAAWMARNSAAFHVPTGLATSSGFNLLAGNGPQTRFDQATADIRWPKGVRAQVVGKNEAERDQIFRRAALASVRERPAEAATLYLKKFLHWFAFRNALVSDLIVAGGAGAGPAWLRDALMLISYGLLLGILGLRLALLRRHPIDALEGLILALYLGGGLVYAMYFTRIRFRLPFDWLLIALDAIFLARLLQRPGYPTSTEQTT